MNVSLTVRLQQMVARRVASGRYGSASEVVREALRLLEEREQLRDARLQQLRRDISVGLRALDRGDRVPFDRGELDAIKAEGRRRIGRKTARR